MNPLPLPIHPFDLVVARTIAAPARALFRCWTEPELLRQWFVPHPWSVSHAAVDLRVGGQSLVTMRDIRGNEYPNPAVFLEIIADRRLVMFNGWGDGWVPHNVTPMLCILDFAAEGNGTRHTARIRHWTEEARDEHDHRGFGPSWNLAFDRLAALATKL